MKKLKHLDGLRGIAAFMVVCHHFLVAFLPAHLNGSREQTNLGNGEVEIWFSTSIFNIFFNGNLAVCIFFVLSGYVLSYSYFKNHSTQFLSALAVKRYFRLVIPVFFTVIIVAILIRLSLMFNLEASKLTKSEWWIGTFWQFYPNVKHMLTSGLFGVFFTNDHSYNTVFWTMGIEFFGSLLVLSIAALTSNLRNRYLIYLILICYMLLIQNYFYLAFILGLCLSDYDLNYENKPILFFNKILKVLLFVSFIILGSFPSDGNIEDTFYIFIKFLFFGQSEVFIHTISAFLIIFIGIHSPKLQKILSLKLFTFLGLISFSMYLLHVPLIGSWACFVFLKVYPFCSYGVALLFTLAAFLPVLIICSYLMAITVDRWSIIWPKWFFEKVFHRREQLNRP